MRRFYRLLFIFSILLLTSCITVKEVKFNGVNGVSFGKPSDNKIPLTLELMIDNPNSFNLKLKKGTVDVFINDQFVGKSKIDKKVVVQKQTKGTYPLTIQTSFSSLSKVALSSLGALFGSKIVLKIDGFIVVKAIVIRKKIKLNFKEEISPKALMNFNT